MQRIIAGNYKGRAISSMPGDKTRPTQARVRKSMIQILEPLENKKVLDLFSGSGVLGIEALSRGAASLISVENNNKIFSLLYKNLNKICKSNDFNAIHMDAFDYLKRCKEKFDVIIFDPPYNKYDYMKYLIYHIKYYVKMEYFAWKWKKITLIQIFLE